jgi:hypothetical protein
MFGRQEFRRFSMSDDRQPVNPAALAVADVARILSVSVEAVERDLREGAPAAADGTVNLVHYAAWLNGKLADGD